MTTLRIETPEWALPMLEPARYKGAHGGRGSGKSHTFAEMMIEAHILDQTSRSVCVREVQKSLAQSVKRLLELKIEQMNAGAYFEVQEAVIKSKKGDGLIIFQGMQNHTADSIKSQGGIRPCLVRGVTEPVAAQPGPAAANHPKARLRAVVHVEPKPGQRPGRLPAAR